MPDNSSIDVLNRMLAILYRSLPMYLNQVSPWMHAGNERAKAVLDQIVADHERDCRRLVEFIIDQRGTIDLGDFPMEYTDLHFLSLEFLTQELVRHQRLDIAGIENCVAWLAKDLYARALAEEILGSERAHLEMLDELAREPAQV
jgi:hypothetical protein